MISKKDRLTLQELIDSWRRADWTKEDCAQHLQDFLNARPDPWITVSYAR